jgi:hypothetical protein
MKKIFFILLVIFSNCANKEKKTKNIDIDNKIENSLPIGSNSLINEKLPEKIIYNNDNKGDSIETKNSEDRLLDSVSSFVENFYEELNIDRKKNFNILPNIKKGIVYNKSDKNGMIRYLDSCYYSKTIYNDGKIKFKLFKDGGRYKSKLGYENSSVVNYLVLAIYGYSNKLIDYKVIFYNESLLYANNSRYFYLDKKLDIYLKDYTTDEEKMNLSFSESFHIKDDGTIIQKTEDNNLISEINTEKTEDISSSNITLKGQWSDDCNSNYRYFLVEESSNKATLAMEPNNYYIILEEIKDKRQNQKFFYKINQAEGMGAQDVFSKNFINDQEVVIINVLSDDNIEFKWLGFYDKISKDRSYKDCPFGNGFCNNKPIILNKCEE